MIKLYSIHIITFVLSLIVRYEWVLKFNIREFIINSLLNIILLQSLNTNQMFSFNGLSWFLSTTFILYLVDIPLILIVKKINAIYGNYIILVILVLQY